MKSCRAIVIVMVLIVTLSSILSVAQADVTTDRIAELSAVKVSDIQKYDTKIPTNGTKKTLKDYTALMDKYPYKESTKGSSFYTYTLSIDRSDFSGSPTPSKEITGIRKYKNWMRITSDGTPNAQYSEELILKDIYTPELVSKTQCYLMLEDEKNYYTYSWIKGAKTGELWTEEKEPTTGVRPTEKPTTNEYMFYKDEVVLGETCKVYSIKEVGEDSIGYYWLSTVSGKIAKYMYVSADSESNIYYENASTYFADYRLNKPDDFYAPPKNVTFIEQNE